MTTATVRLSRHRELVVPLVLAALWVVVAAWRPETTYHLAPLLIAGAAPVAAAADVPRHGDVRAIVRAGLLGSSISLATTALLSAAGWLSGPSLLPFGGAATEAVVFSIAGAAGGVVAALVMRRTVGD